MSTKQERREVYHTPRWRALRERALQKAGFLCETCRAEGLIVAARLVHHKKAIREGGEPFADENLVALCNECHIKAHDVARVPDAWDSWVEGLTEKNL